MSPHAESALDAEATTDLHPEVESSAAEAQAPASAEDQLAPVDPPAPVDQIVVRRNPLLSAILGAAGTGLAMAYFARATESGRALDWALFAVLAGVAVFHLRALLDARTALLVADGQGFRYRLGHQWIGVQWESVAQVVVEPRSHWWRDGRMLVVPHSLGNTLDGLERGSYRQAMRNQKAYGAALALPLGLTTRTTIPVEQMPAEFEYLAQERSDVVLVDGEEATAQFYDAHSLQPRDWSPAVPAPRQAPRSEELPQDLVFDDVVESETAEQPSRLHVARESLLDRLRALRAPREDVAPHTDLDEDEGEGEAEAWTADDAEASDDSSPAAGESWAARSAATLRGVSARLNGAASPTVPTSATEGALARDLDDVRPIAAQLPEERHLRRDGSVDLVFEPVIATPPAPAPIGVVEQAVVIDDFVVHPANEPVIGPEIAVARERVRLTIDELAERTRIRPHVLECLEVDDFGPCGGDIYAKGHLRTLARILGQDGERWVEIFNQRYAGAPISARKVFEAELATGMTGSMRSTIGSPNWGLLGAAVLSLVMLWGLVRLVDDGATADTVPAPALPMGAQWPSRVYDEPSTSPQRPAAATAPLKLVAINAGTRVQVSGPAGNVVLTRVLVIGETVTLKVPTPVTVRAAQGGAIAVTLAGVDRGLLGEAGARAEEVYTRSAQ